MNKLTAWFAAATIATLTVSSLSAQEWQPQQWPVIKHYDGQNLRQIAMPVGGIGTGSISLGGRGEIRDWEIMNVPAKGYSTVTKGNNAPFFAIYVKAEGEQPSTSLLAGPLYPDEYLHYEGRPVNHHGMPRFAEAEFDAAYPFGQAMLSDKDLPVKVKVKAFNPLIPTDADASGLPIAIITYEVTNTSDKPLEVAVCGSIRNFIGRNGTRYHNDWKGDFIPDGASRNRNRYVEQGDLKGINFYTEGVDSLDLAWGNFTLATQAAEGVSYRTSSVPDNWNNAILNFWDDFSADGTLVEQEFSGENDPMASLAVKRSIEPSQTRCFTYFLTWNFPNRRAWSSETFKNYYSRFYPDSWVAAQQIVPRIPELERQTLMFVNALAKSSYPDVIKEAALFNLAVLHSQTVFRIEDGHMMGWEGVMDRFGSCGGSCTHVWNYETATPLLFGELAKGMRDVEFNYALKENGLMNFRAELPLSRAAQGNSAAADGQMGCIMKFYREWQLSGDNTFLTDNYAKVMSALAYAWAEHGWDGNEDGVMEGAQHNTMDVDYYGPNPQMGFWYLGALRAAERMAEAMNDRPTAEKCRRLFTQGSRWIADNLFNGEYFEHRITDPSTFEFIDTDNPDTPIPAFQLGKGCLVDQLVGQYMSDICGLGDLGDKAQMHTALESIMKYNYVEDFSRHFNNMRSYVMGDESGLLMASWPKGRLTVPFPYFAEVMTGFEYCAASSMIYAGMEEQALKCIKSIRDRHDGAKRNPFSEPECGHHYARSMASWTTLLAYSGFHYSGIDHTLGVTSRDGTYFWSNGYAWGTFSVQPDTLTIDVLMGELSLKQINVGERSRIKKNITIKAGDTQTFKL